MSRRELPPLTVRESPRARHVRLRAVPARGIEIVVPAGFPPRELIGIVERHREWIELQHARLQHHLAGLGVPSHMELPALDECWTVSLEPGKRTGLSRQDSCLQLRASDEVSARSLLRRFVLRRAQETLPAWLAATAEATGLHYTAVGIRAQRTRWGSCSRQGHISLNAKLLFLPPELVRHVMVHELCHTVHLDHSPAFWALVARHDPLWQNLHQRLRSLPAMAPAWFEA